MADKKYNLILTAVDKATVPIKAVAGGIKTLSKAVDDFDKKNKAMSSSVSAGITQAIGPYVAFSKVFQSLGKSMEEFEKRSGKTGLKDLKGSISDVSAQIGGSLYPAFERLSKIVDENKDRFLKFGAQVGTIFNGLVGVVQGFTTLFSSMILSAVGQVSEKFFGLKAIILDVFRDKKGAQEARNMASSIASEFESANKSMLDGWQQLKDGSKTVWDGISGNVTVNQDIISRKAKKTKEELQKEAEEAAKYEASVQESLNKKVSEVMENRRKIQEKNTSIVNETEKKYAKDLAKWKTDTHNEYLKEYSAIEIENLNKTFSGRLQVISEGYEEELNKYKEMREEGVITTQEYNDIESELEQNKQDQLKEIKFNAINTGLEIASNVAGQIQTINSMVSQKQLSDLDQDTKKKKENATATIKNKKVLDKEIDKIEKEAEKRRREIAKREKQISLVQSIVNTAQAVSGALTMMPPPVGIAMAIIVGALGAVQAGIIASQAFAKGGVVKREAGVPASGDKTYIRANPGERVLTAEQNRAYEYGSSGLSIGDTTIVINGNADANVVKDALTQSREQQMYEMKRLMLEMKSNNMLPMAA